MPRVSQVQLELLVLQELQVQPDLLGPLAARVQLVPLEAPVQLELPESLVPLEAPVQLELPESLVPLELAVQLIRHFMLEIQQVLQSLLLLVVRTLLYQVIKILMDLRRMVQMIHSQSSKQVNTISHIK